MNLIPTRRGSGQRLYVPLLVGAELANTLRQLFHGETANEECAEVYLLRHALSVVNKRVHLHRHALSVVLQACA